MSTLTGSGAGHSYSPHFCVITIIGTFTILVSVFFLSKGDGMLLYEIVIPDAFKDKFENFINNVNAVNSKMMVKIIKSREIVAIPKQGDDIE